jgi:hypothetical protein
MCCTHLPPLCALHEQLNICCSLLISSSHGGLWKNRKNKGKDGKGKGKGQGKSKGKGQGKGKGKGGKNVPEKLTTPKPQVKSRVAALLRDKPAKKPPTPKKNQKKGGNKKPKKGNAAPSKPKPKQNAKKPKRARVCVPPSCPSCDSPLPWLLTQLSCFFRLAETGS